MLTRDKRTKGAPKAEFVVLWSKINLDYLTHQECDGCMPFWRCFYHPIWSTYKREPLINATIEKVIFEAVIAKSRTMGGTVHAVNSVADHIHVAVSFPPSVAGAEWLRNVKGLSARNVNELFPNQETRFGWQKGYGLLTFGQLNLAYVVAYIENQKSHHALNTLQDYLEESDDD